MTTLVDVPIAEIDNNPFRRTRDYPFVERKIEALVRSYQDVGMWPGVIARRNGNRCEIAFGHHRIEAGKRSNMKSVLLTLMDLSDEQMLGYMGRENLEDYNADFLCMLETWEAAVEFPGRARGRSEALTIARLLGWTYRHERDGDQMNDTARACDAAFSLISGGYIYRDALRDLSVKAAREICGRAQSRMETLTEMARESKRPAAGVEDAKQHFGRAVVQTAKDVREGTVAQRDIRGHVDVSAYRFAKESKKQTPLFEMFGKALIQQIENLAANDSISAKLAEIEKSKDLLQLHEDKQIVERVDFALDQAATRFQHWRQRIVPTAKKVVSIKKDAI